eukprot:m.215262 g.215262  ORF g.215262 m.215262 type:complete len:58 (-) comp18633_c1_seq3:25-198(-)
MSKAKKLSVKLLRHEADLLAAGKLVDVSHGGASSRWLTAASYDADKELEVVTILCGV